MILMMLVIKVFEKNVQHKLRTQFCLWGGFWKKCILFSLISYWQNNVL